MALAAGLGWRPHTSAKALPPLPLVIAALPPPSVDRDEAIVEFFNLMRAEIAGGWVRLRHVEASYRQLAEAKGWPPLSSNSLSRAMVALGCRRSQIDCRATHGGRPTVLHFPKFTGRKEAA